MGRETTRRQQPATDRGQLTGTRRSEHPATEETASSRRRRAVVAGHRAQPDVATALRLDPDPAVRMAALGALARLGAMGVDTVLSALADCEAPVRRRAAKIAGRLASSVLSATDTRRVVAALSDALDDDDSGVVETAAWALGEWGGESSGRAVDLLCEAVRGHHDPLCREAAVAALGAIGEGRALPTVLDALADKPAVRRRAAIALAAFDHPDAEQGLRSCLDDRDWQVRQAAEELLAES